MISKKEREALESIDYANRFLNIRKKYTEHRPSKWLYKKSDIIKVFKKLDINIEYKHGGSYLVSKMHNNYLFIYNFVISKNNFSTYLHIYIDGSLQDARVDNIASLLRYIPYDNNLLDFINSGGLVLDTYDRLEGYINDINALLDDFISEYIKNK